MFVLINILYIIYIYHIYIHIYMYVFYKEVFEFSLRASFPSTLLTNFADYNKSC